MASLCFPGIQQETLSLVVPAGRKIASLPRGVEIKTDLIDYRSNWKMADRVLTVTRTFESHVHGPVCGPDERKALTAVLPAVHDDLVSPIGFETVPVPAVEGAEDK